VQKLNNLPRQKLLSFLEHNGIQPHFYGEKDVRHGNIAIQCPFCLELDHSITEWAMSFKPGHSPVAGCWWDKSHGGNPVKVLMKATGKSEAEVRAAITGELFVDELEAALEEALSKLDQSPRLKEITFPAGAELIAYDQRQDQYHKYLITRGFYKEDIPFLQSLMIHVGDQRIYFPSYYEGVLLGYTGRAIGASKLRYKAEGEERLFFNHNIPDNVHSIIAVEGAFDALPICWSASQTGVWAVAMGGLSKDSQPVRSALLYLGMRYKLYSALDIGAELRGLQMELQYNMIPLDVSEMIMSAEPLKDHPKDVGDLKKESLVKYLKDL
jgi:hypothetical protein